MKASISKLLGVLHGSAELRVFIGLQLLAYGMMRTLGASVPSDPKLSFLPLTYYGALQLIAGIALLATMHLRLHLYGRLAAAFAAGICGILMYDFAPAWNGVIMYAFFVVACIVQTLARHDGC